ncbi:MAG: hypothetical protein AB1726_10110 [Planctomycetota bacterium]
MSVTAGRGRAVTATLVGLALLMGCGGSDDDEEANGGRATTGAAATAQTTEEPRPLEDVQARLEEAGYSVDYNGADPERGALGELSVNGNELIVVEFDSPAALDAEVAAFDSLAGQGADEGFHETRGTRFYVTQQLSKRDFNRVVRTGEGG